MPGAAAGARCAGCGGADLRSWRSVRTFDNRSARPAYDLLRCACCGTATTRVRGEDDPSGLYRGGAYARPPARVDRLVELLRRVGDRALLAAVGPVAPGQRVLDLGAGDGRLLGLLQARGCEARGVDPYAHAGPGIGRVRLEDLDVEPASADVVVLWHVLEHLDDPAAGLGVAARALRPGGRVVISVPSLDSVQARLGGSRWFHLDVPRHTSHFTRTGLERLVARAGLRLVRQGRGGIDQNLLGMAQTGLNWLTRERNVAFRALKGDRENVPLRDLAVSAVAVAPVAVGAVLLESLAAAAGRPGSIVVHAGRADR